MDLGLILAHSGEVVQEAVNVLPVLEITSTAVNNVEASSSISIHGIVYYAHIIGAILGILFSTIVNFKILRAIKSCKITQRSYDWIVRLSWAIRSMVIVMLLSGGWFVYEHIISDSFFELGHRFWFKMTVVAVLLVNGALIHLKCLPLLKPDSKQINAPIIYSIVSLISWYFAGFGGLLLNRFAGLQTSYLTLLISYIAVVIIVFLIFNRRSRQGRALQTPIL